jgi:serine/threonine-protein kinase HipA
MNRCPITYELCEDDRLYSVAGVKKFSRRLSTIDEFPYTAAKQRVEAALRAGRMSIQGIQPKLSARLNLQNSCFEITDRGGRYIIKPQHDIYPELPENEDLCMRMAEAVGIAVPLHALVYCQDGSFSYVIKRFDRIGRNARIAVEDFAQLMGMNRETKYDVSMEKAIAVLDLCTFPVIERVRLFRRCIFNFLVGNEDMHLKNYSLITHDGRTELAPAYDFLSSTTAYLDLGKQLDQIEEIALPLKGKKRKLTRDIWINYFGMERLGLSVKVIDEELGRFADSFDMWDSLIGGSFLSSSGQGILGDLIGTRRHLLKL